MAHHSSTIVPSPNGTPLMAHRSHDSRPSRQITRSPPHACPWVGHEFRLYWCINRLFMAITTSRTATKYFLYIMVHVHIFIAFAISLMAKTYF